ncbi:UNVERIFIED_CONTAM: hypothetical protein GTU68_014890 [Idotea baltica]|nr:hypothetical protein [Idotea baltica]
MICVISGALSAPLKNLTAASLSASLRQLRLQSPNVGTSALPLMPSDLLLKKPVQRHWALGFAEACSGVIWGLPIFRRASRPWS